MTIVYILTCDVITPKWRPVLGNADRCAGKMAAGSRKCGSIRRNCSLKIARKAGFIRSLHKSSRNGMFSRCGSYTYMCVCACVAEPPSGDRLKLPLIVGNIGYLQGMSNIWLYTITESMTFAI